MWLGLELGSSGRTSSKMKTGLPFPHGLPRGVLHPYYSCVVSPECLGVKSWTLLKDT